jgi:hypothetical protein
MENQSDSSAESILHVDDDSFFSKVQKSSSSIGQYSGCYYFSDKQGVIPFKWEEEPGIPKECLPKELEPSPSKIVPPIIPTPTKLKPKHVTKHVSTKSCFYVNPIWLRNSKDKNDVEDKEESFDDINYILKKDEFFSSHRVSKSFSESSTASSKGILLKPSRVADFAKRIYK